MNNWDSLLTGYNSIVDFLCQHPSPWGDILASTFFQTFIIDFAKFLCITFSMILFLVMGLVALLALFRLGYIPLDMAIRHMGKT